MGEFAVLSSSSSEEGTEEEVVLQQSEMEKTRRKDGWSDVRFVPQMSLTVLLVEADDSTRQIIAALLRKCNYKVVAVPDGLRAWEALKGRPQNIDLILTEVELPSISGFALLTLIMEQDICKNIPVIMMSSNDSISIVLKCMLKGAADFLIKPIRKNELRNLWQHVWRRRTPTGGHVSQNLAVAQQKVEATSENNAASNHSSDCVAPIQKNKECSEKGSDAQSSCTTPYLEAESTCLQDMQGLSQLKCRRASNLSNTEIERPEKRVKLDEESLMLESETGGGKSVILGSEVAPCNESYDSTALRLEEDQSCAKTMTWDEGVGPESHSENADIVVEIYGCSDEQIEPSSGAIDLIGTFDNRPQCTYGVHLGSNEGTKKHIFAPHLELSLKRFHSSSSKNQGTDERHTLNHSNASAFSWYNNSKTLQPLFPTSASNCAQPKEAAINSHMQLSNQVSENTVGTPQWHGAASSNSQESMTTLVAGQSGQAEAAFPSPQPGIIPVQGIRLDSLCAGYGHVFPPIFYTQSGLPPVWSPKSTCQLDQSPFPTSSSLHSEVNNSEQGYHPLDEATNNSTDQTVHEHENKLESAGELRHGSPAAGQSASSSLCNGVVSHLNSSVYGSICDGNDGNASQAAAVAKATAPESLNDKGLFSHDGLRGMDSHHSTQREAALTKFRLKRKDRCYEKKVRYQSRKTLAEQRPRIKGQFVRQVQTEEAC